MIVTEQIIQKGKSKNGGWSGKQVNLLNETMATGWKKRVIGKEFSYETIELFIALKDKHLRSK